MPQMAQHLLDQPRDADEPDEGAMGLLLLVVRAHLRQPVVEQLPRRTPHHQDVEQHVRERRPERPVVLVDLLDVEAALEHLFLQRGVRDDAQGKDVERERACHAVDQLERVDHILPGLDRIVDDDVVRRIYLISGELRQRLRSLLDAPHRRRPSVKLEDTLAAALDAHPETVHPGPGEDLDLVALHGRRYDAVDAEGNPCILAPLRGELGQLAQRYEHETVVVEQDRVEMRMERARTPHLADDVADAGVTDFAIVRVVGDEDRVAAIRAVQRAADGPDRRIGEAVVREVIGARDRRESFALAVDPLFAAVFRERQRRQLVGAHQRAERVPFDLSAAAPLEPETRDAAAVRSRFEVTEELGEGELSLAGADRIDIGFDRIFGIDDRMDAAPHHVSLRVYLADARRKRLRQRGVAGHAREGHEVGAGEALGDLVDLIRAEALCLTRLARE